VHRDLAAAGRLAGLGHAKCQLFLGEASPLSSGPDKLGNLLQLVPAKGVGSNNAYSHDLCYS